MSLGKQREERSWWRAFQYPWSTKLENAQSQTALVVPHWVLPTNSVVHLLVLKWNFCYGPWVDWLSTHYGNPNIERQPICSVTWLPKSKVKFKWSELILARIRSCLGNQNQEVGFILDMSIHQKPKCSNILCQINFRVFWASESRPFGPLLRHWSSHRFPPSFVASPTLNEAKGQHSVNHRASAARGRCNMSMHRQSLGLLVPETKSRISTAATNYYPQRPSLPQPQHISSTNQARNHVFKCRR